MIELEWIPVGTCLPDEDLLVLIALNDGEVWPAVRDYGRWIYMSGAEVTEQITHWMNMPPAPDNVRMMRLGEICACLGHDVTEAFLARLGFQPARRDRAARLYYEADFPKIRLALARHALVMAGAPPRWDRSEESDARPGAHPVHSA